MTEYVMDAVVLGKEPTGDYDMTVTLFTETLGKVSARATSARKITSKLAAHVEPGLLTTVRLTAKNGRTNGSRFQLTDALSKDHLFTDYIFLDTVDKVTLGGAHDHDLWQFLSRGVPSQEELLAVSGFGELQLVPQPHTNAF